jgi:hypothetical protein
MHSRLLSINDISVCSFVDDLQNFVWLYSYQIANAAIIGAPGISDQRPLWPPSVGRDLIFDRREYNSPFADLDQRADRAIVAWAGAAHVSCPHLGPGFRADPQAAYRG